MEKVHKDNHHSILEYLCGIDGTPKPCLAYDEIAGGVGSLPL